MLSYRHAYHAGNFADLLKHLIQIEILKYMGKKEKPFEYIDTHAGAGAYRLDSSMAEKNKEYQNGIGRFLRDETNIPKIEGLVNLVRDCDKKLGAGDGILYPGSPLIASELLRPQDKAWLYELHSTDFPLLKEQFVRNKHVFVRQEDGFKGLLGLLPCASRRAFVLIDPPYEIKDDYSKVVSIVEKAHRKMSNAIFAIWYPVVERDRIDLIKSQFIESGIRSIAQFELGVKADTDEKGMTSAGMIVINPPWTLFGQMQELLPKLADVVSQDGQPHFRCEEWVGE